MTDVDISKAIKGLEEEWDDRDQWMKEAVFGEELVGACCGCGAVAYNVDPDARGDQCEECDENMVYGASELLLMYVP